jgi:hypothetical protein
LFLITTFDCNYRMSCEESQKFCSIIAYHSASLNISQKMNLKRSYNNRSVMFKRLKKHFAPLVQNVLESKVSVFKTID